MNLNIKQFLPAPQNTLTLRAICLNIKKNILLGRIKGDQINIIINTENILFQHSEEAWHNPLAPTTSKKSYGTEQVNTQSVTASRNKTIQSIFRNQLLTFPLCL